MRLEARNKTQLIHLLDMAQYDGDEETKIYCGDFTTTLRALPPKEDPWRECCETARQNGLKRLIRRVKRFPATMLGSKPGVLK